MNCHLHKLLEQIFLDELVDNVLAAFRLRQNEYVFKVGFLHEIEDVLSVEGNPVVDEDLVVQLLVQWQDLLNPNPFRPRLDKIDVLVEFLYFQNELKGGIAEHVLHQPMIQVGQNGLHDPSDHAHAHLVVPTLKLLEDLTERGDELFGIEQMVLHHIFGGLGLVEYGGEVALGGHFEDIPAIDIKVILSDFFADEPRTRRNRIIYPPQRRWPDLDASFARCPAR